MSAKAVEAPVITSLSVELLCNFTDVDIIKSYIGIVAEEYGVSKYVLTTTIENESTYRTHVIHYNDGGSNSYGIAQIKVATWKSFYKMFSPKYDIPTKWETYTGEDIANDWCGSVKMLAISIKEGYGYLWTGYRKIK